MLAEALDVDVKDFFTFKQTTTKDELIIEINKILEASTLKDIQFVKDVLVSYIESKC